MDTDSVFLSVQIRVYLWPCSLLQRIRLVTSQRKIFSQRMSLPIVRQKNAAQIRMIVENYSKQIVSLAFVPICPAPDAGNARHVRVILVQNNFQADAMELRSRKKVIVDFKARLFFRSAIKAAQIRKEIEFQTGSCFQKRARIRDEFARNDNRCFAESLYNFADPFSTRTLQRRRDRRRRRACFTGT